MASYSKVILLGNLTRDPELRVTQQGTSVCKFSVAVSRQFRSSDGTNREETAFVDVDAFGKSAETIAKYFTKGRPILVDGRLRMDQWETQSGERRSRLVVVLENFQFVGGRNDDDQQRVQAPADDVVAAASAPEFVEDLSKGKSKRNKPAPMGEIEDEDVPF